MSNISKGLVITVQADGVSHRHISVPDAAELVGVTDGAIYEWIKAGAVTHVRRMIGKRDCVFPAESDIMTIANMEVEELHAIGIMLSSEDRRTNIEAWRQARIATLPKENAHDSWTGEQIRVIRRDDLPITEMARLTGRSYQAVMDKRIVMGFTSDIGRGDHSRIDKEVA